MSQQINNLSPLAHIHPDAQLGNQVTIEAFSFIDKNVVIGDGTWIGPHVTILEGARIGKNCRIHSGAVIAGTPQDLKFEGEETLVEIGDNTTIRECATINRATKHSWKTTVGRNCLLMAYTHVAHDCHVGNHVIMANCVNLAGHVTIEDHAILEGMVAVQQFVRVGAHSFIAGGSLVRKNVPPFVRAAREPLAYIGVNSIGLSRRGFSRERILQIQSMYRHLFIDNLSVRKAVDLIMSEEEPSYERDQIVELFAQLAQRSLEGLLDQWRRQTGGGHPFYHRHGPVHQRQI